MNKPYRVFVIGFMGTARKEKAMELAQEKNIPYLDMDEEIQRLDGRSILRLCMTMGEHAYRNKEFELLSKLADEAFDIGMAAKETYPEELVVSCGDGIILDDECYEILKNSEVVLVDDDPEKLWEVAKEDKNLPYAFLHVGNKDEQKQKFIEFYELRKELYMSLINKSFT